LRCIGLDGCCYSLDVCQQRTLPILPNSAPTLLDPPELRAAYRTVYTEALRPHYPRRPDGATLLPFRRQFLLARR
jgi:hypothetical protein